ncbi:MAG: formamidopyrimidine-DNA glycosylase [Oceanicoccus sp.]|jgi:formamidopyrimidine-DNA glycosylase
MSIHCLLIKCDYAKTMPELPEVETTLRGIEPFLTHRKISRVTVRNPRLRWPIPEDLSSLIEGRTIQGVGRRAKYLLIHLTNGTVIVHLGMSGNLRIVDEGSVVGKHDHVDIVLSDRKILRFNDTRRFGCMLWQSSSEAEHKLLASLGPEPLSAAFDASLLFKRSRGRTVSVKSFIMDGKIVVGVGNIYANEALFAAGIRPDKVAGDITKKRYQGLVDKIKKILAVAIEHGGTTLKDFVGGDGKPGYFKQELKVYGRGGDLCYVCKQVLIEIRLGQRSTVYCKHCQR